MRDITYTGVSVSKIYAQRCTQATTRDRLENACARPRLTEEKCIETRNPGLTFRSFLRASLVGLYPTNDPNDEPRDEPFKVSGIRLPKKNRRMDRPKISHSLFLSRIRQVASDIDAYKIFIEQNIRFLCHVNNFPR